MRSKSSTSGGRSSSSTLADVPGTSAAQRLEIDIGRRFGSERKFQRALKKAAPELRGTARNTIRGYLSGEAEPDPGWVRCAAEVLGVREEWLASGSGARTPEDEEIRRSRPEALGSVARRLASGVPFWDLLNELARAAVIECWRELVGEEDPDEIVERRGQFVTLRGDQIAVQLGTALDAPIRELGLRGGVVPQALDSYTVLICEGIRQYANERRQLTEGWSEDEQK